jgi:four helix bundle protein
MDGAKPNPVLDKSYAFALKIVQLSRHLQTAKKEFVLSKQVLRSGTSIGANIEEATAGLTKKDFTARMCVASKEARETRYWLRLLKDSDYAAETVLEPLLADCNELVRLLTAIVKTAQETC